MANVEVRKATNTVGETGAGVEDREVVTYYLGSEIDGVFVPFASVDSDAVESHRTTPVQTDDQKKAQGDGSTQTDATPQGDSSTQDAS